MYDGYAAASVRPLQSDTVNQAWHGLGDFELHYQGCHVKTCAVRSNSQYAGKVPMAAYMDTGLPRIPAQRLAASAASAVAAATLQKHYYPRYPCVYLSLHHRSPITDMHGGMPSDAAEIA